MLVFRTYPFPAKIDDHNHLYKPPRVFTLLLLPTARQNRQDGVAPLGMFDTKTRVLGKVSRES